MVDGLDPQTPLFLAPVMVQPAIFPSYRRTDSEQVVFGLGLLLDQRYPDGQVVWDRGQVTINKPARKYRQQIDRLLRECAVVIVVIGEHWLDVQDSTGPAGDRGGQRLARPMTTCFPQ